jgi:hypothetical protein
LKEVAHAPPPRLFFPLSIGISTKIIIKKDSHNNHTKSRFSFPADNVRSSEENVDNWFHITVATVEKVVNRLDGAG